MCINQRFMYLWICETNIRAVLLFASTSSYPFRFHLLFDYYSLLIVYACICVCIQISVCSYIFKFLMQRNCHRNIYNQFSRGLSLHCSWQQDWYHGCGKSETAGQDHAGTRWLNDYWKATIFHFLMLYWFQIPFKPFFVKCVLLLRNLASGVRACGWLWPSAVSGSSRKLIGWLVHCRLAWKKPHFYPMFLLSPPDSVWRNTVHLNGRDYTDAGL